MTLSEFLNALRILRSIDRFELADVGIQLKDGDWCDFRDSPFRWLCLASVQDAEAIWSIVQRRQPKEKDPRDGKG